MATQRIAVVDADAAFLDLAHAYFNAAGYAVYTFASPEEAYAMLQAEPPSAAIIGLRFPDCQSSIDLATTLKLHRATRGLPVILTSEDTAQLYRYAGRLRNRDGAALWALPKPLDLAASLQIFAQALAPLEREAP